MPSSRLGRLARLGGMAGGVAGGMLLDGVRRFAGGERPKLGDLLLTPANVLRVTEQLSQLRGAAMKIGQILSMDAGDVLPPELAEILGRLRADAHPMPRRQVQGVLDGSWGRGWESRFQHFAFEPVAAASIGQVHRARAADGRDLAIKVQYPGVRQSIGSDVDNVASLLRLSGLLPKGLDVAPLLSEAKRQLHEEADYENEARCLARFGALLADDPGFHVPAVHADLTTANVLAMSFAPSAPIESLANAPQAERDRVAARLIDLALRELFVFQLMQTDPNLANYRYDAAAGRVVLLDFGATRAFPAALAEECRRLAAAGLAGDAPAARRAMMDIGVFDAAVPQRHQDAVMAMFEMAIRPLRESDVFDFGDPTLLRTLREEGMAFVGERDGWRVPPVDTLFLQRKFGGTYLLAARLRARVDVKAIIARYL